MPFHKKNKLRTDTIRQDSDKRNRSEYDDENDGELEEQPKKKKHRLRKFVIVTTILCIIVFAVNLAMLLFSGKLLFNEPKKRDYPIRGPVVSQSEGKISWKKFAMQNIQMAYIRATKSTAYEDENFRENWENSAQTSLPTGALHIFDPGLDGKEQAEHFINVVGDLKGRLIPAVEIKFSGFYRIVPLDYDKITQNLMAYAEEINEHYGVYPIIRCDKRSYEKIILNPNLFSRTSTNNFHGCLIWYESLYSKPEENINWNLWSYSDRVKYSYYESKDFITMSVFNGAKEDFRKLILGDD